MKIKENNKDIESDSQEEVEHKDNYKTLINKKEKECSLSLWMIELFIYIGIIIIFTNLLSDYIMQRTIVEGVSMVDTLYNGDNLIVEKISYRLGHLERFDIIAFYPNGKDTKDYYIKRIIGLPGEHLQIKDNKIYINGEVLEEDYGNTSNIGYTGIAREGLDLKEDEYFVIGDNRTKSFDSRYSQIGPININKIEGKAVFRIWPLERFGTLN